jgi:hypothetical protein
MKPQPRKYFGFFILALCGYGLGLVLGQRVAHTIRAWPVEVESLPSAEINQPTNSTAEPALANASQSSSNEPPSDLSAFLSAPGTELQVFETRFRQAKDSDQWDIQLAPLVSALSPAVYPAVWKLVADWKTDTGDTFKNEVMEIWAKRAPESALAEALAAPRLEERTQLMEKGIIAWAGIDSTAALTWVDRMAPGTLQDRTRLAAIYGLAEKNPLLAEKLLFKFPLGGGRQSDVAARIIENLAKTDPDAARDLLDHLSPKDRHRAFRAVANAKVSRGVAEAIAWAKTLPNAGEQQIALESVVAKLAESDTQEAIEFVNSQTEPKLRNQLANTLARRWASRDSQAALDWLARLPDGPFREQAWDGVNRELMDKDPAVLANFALNSFPAGAKRAAALKDLANRWMDMEEDDQPMAWASQLAAGPDRNAFLSGLCQSLQMKDDQDAARLALSMSPGEDRTAVLTDVAKNAASRGETELAITLSTNIPEGSERNTIILCIASGLENADPSVALDWLQSLPDDDTRSQCAAIYGMKEAASQPEVAAQCVCLIPKEANRQSLIQKIYQSWVAKDPEAAQAWLDSLPSSNP